MAHIDDDDAPPSNQDEGEESNGEFAAAFAERATDREADTREPPADEQSSADQEPAPAGTEQAPAPAAASDTGSESRAPAFDPFAGMTPELRAHWEKVASSERSQRGRVGALTKKLQANTQPAPAAPAKAEEQAPAKDGEGASASDLEARLAAVADEYGDVNGPLVEAIKGIQSDIASLKASPQREQMPVSDDEAEAVAKAYDTLAGDHPDYVQIAEDPAFDQWAASKPASVKALVNSFDPAEVSLALSLYKAEAGLARAAAGGTGKPGSTASSDRRERQLEGSRDTRSRGAPAAAGVPNDFRTAFAARVEQHKKAAT